ncbi:MAG: hypothetical protein KDB02_01790 [Acidimicrobiales bacterium]|nr:hypothetical protein [Acidimicrobiales bacterium]
MASDIEAGRNIAATSLSIHAGINSADAACGARLGKRAAGEDHDQVLVAMELFCEALYGERAT